MKVLLNGATGGTNFGDFLFAKIFQESVSKQVGEENVFWYDARYSLSVFYKKHLNYNKKYKLKDIDALVCISGGYFCGDDHKLKDYIIRYLMYFHLCIRCIHRKIPIAIIGVEVAKPKKKLMERIEKYILSKANMVVVRNSDSYEQLKEYGLTDGISTADTAHTITTKLFAHCHIPDDILRLNGKIVFFHIQISCLDKAEQLLPAFNAFLNNHSDYQVIIGTDQYLEDYSYLRNFSKKINCKQIVIYCYDDPIALCKVISKSTFIITPKLHVGIVGATLSKSVVSFSKHSEKITRFYRQLNENERSLPMSHYTDEQALGIMEKYHDTPIHIPKSVIDLANKNLEYLESFIDEIKLKESGNQV